MWIAAEKFPIGSKKSLHRTSSKITVINVASQNKSLCNHTIISSAGSKHIACFTRSYRCCRTQCFVSLNITEPEFIIHVSKPGCVILPVAEKLLSATLTSEKNLQVKADESDQKIAAKHDALRRLRRTHGGFKTQQRSDSFCQFSPDMKVFIKWIQ